MRILVNEWDTLSSVMFPSKKRLPESLYTEEQMNRKKNVQGQELRTISNDVSLPR